MNNIHPDVLKRYAEGKCSPSDIRLVEQWLDNGHTLSADQKQPDNPALEQEIWNGITDKAMRVPSRPRFRLPVFGLIAASVLIIAGIFLFTSRPIAVSTAAGHSLQTYQVPNGKMVNIILNDGTSVQLAGGSAIQYPSDFSGETREVTLLTGEAFFKVAHNAQKPFIVHNSNTKIKVLGTQFNVWNANDLLRVTLSQGSISFQGINQQETVLKPGQQLTFNKKLNRVQKIEEVDPALSSSWTSGTLWFKATALTEVLQKLEAYYGVSFELQGHPDLKVPLTGKFKQQPISRILKLIENSSDLKFRQKNNRIIIYTETR